MVKIKLIKDASAHKKGDVVNYSTSSAKDMVESGAGIYLDKLNEHIISEFIDMCSFSNISLWEKERGYDEEILKELNIGYCCSDIYSKLFEIYDKESLEDVGLTKKGKHKFVNRIIIPYNNNYFSARAFDRNTVPKNLFLSGIGKQLYFIEGKTDKCFVYEGETSLIAGKHIYPKDYHCSIGGTGSHALLKDLKKKFKGKNIIFCYDNDDAGKECLEKSVKHLKNFELYRLDLPIEYNDIDDWHKIKGNQELKEIKIEDIKHPEIEKEIKINEVGVKKGGRNNAFFNLAVKKKVEGKNKKETTEELTLLNKKNDPPLSENELKSIIESAYSKKISKKKNKDSDEDDCIYISSLVTPEYLIEQVYQDKINQYCIYEVKNDKITYAESFELDGIEYKPIQGEEIEKRAVLLPSMAEDYESHDILIEKIKNFVKKWVDIPDTMVQFAIWNIKRSWVYDKFHTLNYLRALGDTGQGKSRFLDTLGSIHYKPIATSGATTSAPIFRIINKWRGTLIMDEADFQKSDESQDIIKIINMGYEKGKHIMRCDQNDANKISFFDPFCPKILATRRAFNDKAVESRCITQVMLGTRRNDIPYNLTEEFWKESEQIRNMLLMWRFKNYYLINPDKKIDLGLGSLEPRVKQIVNSVVSLFNERTEEFEKFKKFILKYQEDLIDERKNSFDGQIVEAIYNLVITGNEHISALDIIERGQITNSRGNLISPRKISSHLRSLGFEKASIIKVSGQAKRCIPLDVVGHLIPLFRRYGYEVTKVTQYTDSSKNEELCENPTFSKNAGLRIHRNDRNSVTFYNKKNEKQDPLDVVCQAIKSGFTTFERLKDNLNLSDDELEPIISQLLRKGDIFENPKDHFKII